MHEMTLEQVAHAVGGKVHGDPNIRVGSISTDSREIKQEALFCAITGEKTDGHEHISQALNLGASASLVTKLSQEPCVVVPMGDDDLDGVIIALGRLAAYERTLLSAQVIGVTGSSGKTTTKDIIGQVLSCAGKVHAPAGSPNNELGLPLTILTAPLDSDFIVAEMGMRGIGHIAYLCEIAKPTIAVVTNVGHAHVGEVGSVQEIAQAKSELPKALPEEGLAILNADDPNVIAMATDLASSVLTYGLCATADVRAQNIATNERGEVSFTLVYQDQNIHVQLPFLGEHNVSNALAASAVAINAGLTLDQIAKALENLTQKSKWRMQVERLESGVTLINDAYNANPESMAAAIKTLAGLAPNGRTWAVLGEMAELGTDTLEEHDRVGRLIVRLNISQLVTVGQGARTMFLAANQEGSWDGESVWFPDFSQACDYIIDRVEIGDTVLFKASRSAGFELLAQAVQERLIANWAEKGSAE